MERMRKDVSAGALGPRPGEMLPYFELPSTADGALSSRRFKGRSNLVLIFARDDGCEPCERMLRGFAERYGEFVAEEAEVLGLIVGTQAEARRLAARLHLPFPLLADADGAVHAAYGAGDAGEVVVYVADRYGEVHRRWSVEGRQGPLPVPLEALETLRFIEIQCPE